MTVSRELLQAFDRNMYAVQAFRTQQFAIVRVDMASAKDGQAEATLVSEWFATEAEGRRPDSTGGARMTVCAKVASKPISVTEDGGKL